LPSRKRRVINLKTVHRGNNQLVFFQALVLPSFNDNCFLKLKILLLKLGIKEVVWQKNVTNFQILSFLYKYFIENRQKLLYELNIGLLLVVVFLKSYFL
jgi:hypothetical protein